MTTATRVFLARLVGIGVFDPNGDQVGKVRDAIVVLRIGPNPPRLTGLVVEVPPRKSAGEIMHALREATWALVLPVIVHIYASIWVKGTTRAMTRGTVSRGWAQFLIALLVPIAAIAANPADFPMKSGTNKAGFWPTTNMCCP
mgnify:CR=1 FL=1